MDFFFIYKMNKNDNFYTEKQKHMILLKNHEGNTHYNLNENKRQVNPSAAKIIVRLFYTICFNFCFGNCQLTIKMINLIMWMIST